MSEDNQNISKKTGRPKQRRGFALVSAERLAALSAKGGREAHKQGGAHEFTHEEAVEAGRKGGKSRVAKERAKKEVDAAGGGQ